MKKESGKSISSLLIDGKIIPSAKEMSNYFNNFFKSVVKKINKNIVKSKKHLCYLGPENYNTILLSPTLPEDIEGLIKSMKTNKASGPNSIPIKILKLFKKEFSKPLSDIINLSFNQGVFPNLLKLANVIPIHKKVKSLIVITTNLFLFYLTLVTFLMMKTNLLVEFSLIFRRLLTL